MYSAHRNMVVFNGETRAVCADAQKAAELLNKAIHLNDIKRKYTEAARTIYKAESLPGFRWLDREYTA